MNIAEKIITYRKAKNLTQSQLADLLFVSDKTVSKWETGRGYPEISILPKLASVLETTVDDLLKEDGNAPTREPQSEMESLSSELPSDGLPQVNENTEVKFVLPRSGSLIVWICTVFVPMGLFFILSLAAMLSGYSNSVETGLLLLLVNGLSRGIIALTLYLSYKDSRALMIYAIYGLVFNTIAAFSNFFSNGSMVTATGNFVILMSLLAYLLGVAANILIILFALRKLKKAKPIVLLLWIAFGVGMVVSLMTYRTDFFLNSLNDLIMILVGVANVIGFTRLYPRFEIRRVPVTSKSTFFKDPA